LQGYFTVDTPPFTSPANMVKIAEYYAEEVSSGTALNADQGLNVLVENYRPLQRPAHRHQRVGCLVRP
jgi:hypothetical protein